MPDPVDSLKQTSDALLVAQTDLDPTRVDMPPHEAFGLLSSARRNIDKVLSYTTGSGDVPPAPTQAPEPTKEPGANKHPIPPQKPELPDGTAHEESEGGLPEKQPSQDD